MSWKPLDISGLGKVPRFDVTTANAPAEPAAAAAAGEQPAAAASTSAPAPVTESQPKGAEKSIAEPEKQVASAAAEPAQAESAVAPPVDAQPAAAPEPTSAIARPPTPSTTTASVPTAITVSCSLAGHVPRHAGAGGSHRRAREGSRHRSAWGFLSGVCVALLASEAPLKEYLRSSDRTPCTPPRVPEPSTQNRATPHDTAAHSRLDCTLTPHLFPNPQAASMSNVPNSRARQTPPTSGSSAGRPDPQPSTSSAIAPRTAASSSVSFLFCMQEGSDGRERDCRTPLLVPAVRRRPETDDPRQTTQATQLTTPPVLVTLNRSTTAPRQLRRPPAPLPPPLPRACLPRPSRRRGTVTRTCRPAASPRSPLPRP